jgi:peptide/nickel transport system substrate-binding protein
MFKRIFGILLLAAGMSGWSAVTGFAQDVQRGGNVVYGQTVDVFRFDPYDLAIGNYTMLNTVYDPLVREDENLVPQPWLAESWQFSGDGTNLTLKLRQGVRFHSGREMTADDVKWTIQQYQDPANAAIVQQAALRIKDVQVVDPHTLVLKFDAPFPSVFDLLELIFVIDRDHAGSLKNKPAGSGPFELTSWEPGVQATYASFKDYWRRGEPYLDGFVQKVFADPQSMVAALQSGDIDIAMYPSVQDYDRLKGNPAYTAVSAVGCCEVNINFNTAHKPWDNKLVRQAINHAIDRKRLVDIAFNGNSFPICQPIRKGWAHDPSITVDVQCKFDLDLAKSLLAQAGYPNGFKMEALVSSEVMPESTILAQIMKEDLAKIGVELNILDLEQTAYNNTGDKSLYKDMYIQIVGRTNKDPGSLFGLTVAFRPKTNVAQFHDPEYENLILKGTESVDQAKRQTIYWKLAQMVVDQAFSLVAAPRPNLFLMKATVKGFSLNPDGLLYTGQLWMSK